MSGAGAGWWDARQHARERAHHAVSYALKMLGGRGRRLELDVEDHALVLILKLVGLVDALGVSPGKQHVWPTP